jgi:hypothetical protein
MSIFHVRCFIVVVLVGQRKDGNEEGEYVCLGGCWGERGVYEGDSAKKLVLHVRCM